jgi:hypothetical protein
MTGQLLTAEQPAERWQVKPSHVYRLTARARSLRSASAATTPTGSTRSSALAALPAMGHCVSPGAAQPAAHGERAPGEVGTVEASKPPCLADTVADCPHHVVCAEVLEPQVELTADPGRAT